MRDWTAEETQAIASAVDGIVNDYPGSAPVSVESLLEQWQQFVKEVESGYSMSIYDYTNDLSTRDLLEKVMSRTPPGVQAALRLEISPWDDRYQLATRPSSAAIPPGSDIADNPRWQRIPRVLIGELRDDFLAEGLITDPDSPPPQ